MSTGEELIAGIIKARTALLERGIVPSRIEVTSAQYEALKKHCQSISTYSTGNADSILGLQIVINDNPQR